MALRCSSSALGASTFGKGKQVRRGAVATLVFRGIQFPPFVASGKYSELEKRLATTEQSLAEAEQRRIEAEQRRIEAEQRRIEAEQRRIEAEEQRMEAEEQRMEAEERADKEARLARWRVLAGTILTCGLLFLLQWAFFGPGAAAALGSRPPA
ncbi:hypothetical protein HYH03_000999 [Edaphochlamys debaryana]|uniref:Uncharacterized protein n=1 Tax=Edaphochlamys debaryana TaxID=47281 RepID=A0A835YNY1_9CHLO|nr:hypothetical protein HYH03_000999 [Edaphochlamys debaryana]|eukprot:KAG2501184.1 hypothetical protein HYH03_000999 [Edaphochlamys debaryana]